MFKSRQPSEQFCYSTNGDSRARIISRLLPHRTQPPRRAPWMQPERPPMKPSPVPGPEGCASAVMHRVLRWTEFKTARQDRDRGAFYWQAPDLAGEMLMLWMVLPNGTTSCICIEPVPVGCRRRNEHGLWSPPAWSWDGSLEEPTLSPSLSHGRSGDRWYWHGHILAGIMKGS